MSRLTTNTSEIVSLTVMLLLIITLIASQAGTTFSETTQGAATLEPPRSQAVTSAPVKATIKAHITGQPFKVSVDPMSGFGNVRFVFN